MILAWSTCQMKSLKLHGVQVRSPQAVPGCRMDLWDLPSCRTARELCNLINFELTSRYSWSALDSLLRSILVPAECYAVPSRSTQTKLARIQCMDLTNVQPHYFKTSYVSCLAKTRLTLHSTVDDASRSGRRLWDHFPLNGPFPRMQRQPRMLG